MPSNLSFQNGETSKGEPILPGATAGPGSIGGGVFNFGAGSFKPKDNSEGTMLSIKRLRRHSQDLNDGHYHLEAGDLFSKNPMMGLSASKLLINPINDS